MLSPLIANSRRGTLRFWGATNRWSSKIAGKAPHGTESESAQTLARAPKNCAPASAQRVAAASSNGIKTQRENWAGLNHWAKSRASSPLPWLARRQRRINDARSERKYADERPAKNC